MGEATHTDEIITGFAQGSLKAVREIYRIHEEALTHFAEQIMQDAREARVIVIETFIKLLNRREHFSNHSDIKAFLYIATRNAAVDFLRHLKNNAGKDRDESFIPPESTENFDDPAIVETADNLLWEGVKGLSSPGQLVFRLLFMNGLPTSTVASQSGMEPEEIFVYRKRMITKLQKVLSDNKLFSTPFFAHFLTVGCRRNVAALNSAVL